MGPHHQFQVLSAQILQIADDLLTAFRVTGIYNGVLALTSQNNGIGVLDIQKMNRQTGGGLCPLSGLGNRLCDRLRGRLGHRLGNGLSHRLGCGLCDRRLGGGCCGGKLHIGGACGRVGGLYGGCRSAAGQEQKRQ